MQIRPVGNKRPIHWVKVASGAFQTFKEREQMVADAVGKVPGSSFDWMEEYEGRVYLPDALDRDAIDAVIRGAKRIHPLLRREESEGIFNPYDHQIPGSPQAKRAQKIIAHMWEIGHYEDGLDQDWSSPDHKVYPDPYIFGKDIGPQDPEASWELGDPDIVSDPEAIKAHMMALDDPLIIYNEDDEGPYLLNMADPIS